MGAFAGLRANSGLPAGIRPHRRPVERLKSVGGSWDTLRFGEMACIARLRPFRGENYIVNAADSCAVSIPLSFPSICISAIDRGIPLHIGKLPISRSRRPTTAMDLTESNHDERHRDESCYGLA